MSDPKKSKMDRIKETGDKILVYLAGSAALLSGIISMIKGISDPTYKIGNFKVSPKHQRVFKPLTPVFGKTVDFKTGKVYDVEINHGDTTLKNGQPIYSPVDHPLVQDAQHALDSALHRFNK